MLGIFFFLIYLFMAVLGLCLCARAFPSCGKRGPLFMTVCGPLTIVASLVAEHRLQMRRLSSCGSRAQLLRGMWDLPRPGLEPVSTELAGRFSTTAPPGKPFFFFFFLLQAALVASCLRGALPPVDLRAVCLVRAIVRKQNKKNQVAWHFICSFLFKLYIGPIRLNTFPILQIRKQRFRKVEYQVYMASKYQNQGLKSKLKFCLFSLCQTACRIQQMEDIYLCDGRHLYRTSLKGHYYQLYPPTPLKSTKWKICHQGK